MRGIAARILGRRASGAASGSGAPELVRASNHADQGDAREHEEVYRVYASYVAGIVIRLLGRSQDLEDIVHDVFVEILSNCHAIRDREAMRGWVRVVTVRTALAHARKRRRRDSRSVPLEDDTHASPARSAEVSAEVRRLWVRLRDLPVDLRIPWVAHYWEECTLEETAEMLECSLAAVKRRLKKANGHLKGAFDAPT